MTITNIVIHVQHTVLRRGSTKKESISEREINTTLMFSCIEKILQDLACMNYLARKEQDRKAKWYCL